jgi:predicted CXXCH cytochrome family protein
MQRRVRTTKKLAQRIDMHYFKYPHPLRRWRFLLSAGAVLLAVVWIAWAGFAGDEEIYSGGPVSDAHAVIGQQCNVCHVAQPGVFREHVTSEACIACHDGPLHSLRETYTPDCGSCHVEHKGIQRLAEVDDKACAQCHASLRVRSGEPEVARSVSQLNRDHPEIAARKDPGTIKLNHKVHLREGLRGPRGAVKLECDDCHRTAAVREPWPFGDATFRTAAARKEDESVLGPRSDRAFLQPVKYAQACAWCHPLYFDKRIEEAAPHDKPEVVRAFVVKKFQEYLAKNPGAWRQVEQPERRLPGRPMEVRTAARSPQEWLEHSIADAEAMLWGKTCKECHSLSAPASDKPPQVAKANMLVRWMPNTEFDHEPHRMMQCNACHAAETSTETSDVLMPGIKDCQQCHAPGKAESRCFECHRYHDWTKERRVKGKYSIQQLLRSARPMAGAASEDTK